MKRLFLFALLVLGPLLSFAQLAPGSIAFTGINGDGTDDLALVVLDAIPANTTIYLRDSEWTGSSFPLSDEGRITWTTGGAVIPAGTVVTFTNVNNAAPTVSVGLASQVGNPGISNDGDGVFAFLGSDDNTPTTFLAAVATNGAGSFGTLSGTGLSLGSTAVALSGEVAIGIYNGTRTGISRSCLPSVINNSANWQTQINSGGNQAADGTAPDVPFSTTAFTFGASCPLPTVAFSVASQTVNENAGQATVTLSITNPGSQSASVQLFVSSGSATNGSDYSLSVPQTVTFPASSSASQTVVIPVTDDATAEADEYILLRLQNPIGAQIGSGNSQVVFIRDNDKPAPTSSDPGFQLQLLTSYRNPTAGSSEIVTFDKGSRRLFIANSIGNKIDIVNFDNPSAPTPVSSIDVSALGGSINSVAARDGIVAAAIESVPKTDNGKIVFFDVNGNKLSEVTAGALPDAVFFSPDGRYVVTPNEGEPSNDYQTDPEGSVTIVDISGGVANLTQANATTVSFASLNGMKAMLRSMGVRLFGKKGGVVDGSSVAEDLEPEYITFTPDSKLAYVTLQENNAIIVIDLVNKTIATKDGQPFIKPLGLKDHSQVRNALDPTDQGGNQVLINAPIFGMYMPDAIATFTANGQTYFVTANEGDAREYDPVLIEETRIGSLNLDPTAFPNAADLKNNLILGRLNATNQTGDTDGDGDIDKIHVLGSRSFTVWDANGNLVWDSGDDFERYTRDNFSNLFNVDNGTSVATKNRSDNKGPEPEGITTAQIGSKTYAFITLERTGGVMVYDVTTPTAPQFVTYTVNRSVPPNNATDDRGPEGVIFISAADSPNSKPLVLLANETSNSISVYQINGVQSQQPLALIDPLYNCATGEITFRSEGGDGSPVEYMAIGVKPYSTNPNGVIEQEKRNDPNSGTVVTLMARQSGVVVMRDFDFGAFCSGTNPSQPLALIEPLYNCQTGAITFRTTGGNGTPIEFRSVGIKDWSTDPNGVIDAAKRNDPNSGTVVTLMARQSGVVVMRDFDFGAFCGGTNPSQPLTLIEPLYNCQTGAITFRTTGGNGTPIEFRSVGIKDWSTNPNGVIEQEKRNDPNSGTVVTLMARQSGVVVMRDFDFGAFCRQSARVAATEAVESLNVRLLGNPTREDVVAEIKGAAGQTLTVSLTDLNGRAVETKTIDKAAPTEWAVFDIRRQSTGILLLKVATPKQTRTVRVVKQ
ncbi:T9SS C-terminal target domain-containing protein [Fibrisoma montanum]|uniref:T9SS C-terminal target domain-containing protein n=1 Tax=Fibrisoma montanum TaxID=2305895 RepID=A0A418MEL6_9BACT|nr:choice-of-anchor I family protein [Fibrisoma montanum]RIV25177.1 T9SS C-terminal target domain-containing protein [Fibrisoma montanum]